MNTDKTITQLINQYLGERDIMQSSIRIYRYTIHYFFRWLVNNGHDSGSPERTDVISYKRDLKTKYRSATVALYINSIKGFFRWCNERGICDNITSGVRNEKRMHTFSRDPLTTDQVQGLFDSIGTDAIIDLRDRAIIYLLYFNGLRVIEATRIYHGDIDLVNNRVFIIGKGQHERQPVDINPIVASALDNYIQEKHNAGLSVSDKDPLFVSHTTSTALKPTWVSELISTRMVKAGIKTPKITAHSLRHSAAVHMINGGYDLYAVQLFLRHSDTNTSRIYTRYAEENKLKQRAPTMYLHKQIKTTYNNNTKHLNT